MDLAPSTSLEAVCSIFETLNRTGIRLSVFDLLAARFYAKNLDLRRKWEQMSIETPIIEAFEIDRYYVLQSIALRAKGSVKRGDVFGADGRGRRNALGRCHQRLPRRPRDAAG